MKIAPCFVSLVLLLGVRVCFAQDVTVSELSWVQADDAPDELPKFKGKPRPAFPEEMRKASELGYVVVRRFIDATGKSLSLNVNGSHPPYQKAVAEDFPNWQLTAAKRGGKAVDGLVWLSFIFNPKSAATKGPDATPRLLAVTPVFTSERPAPASQPPLVRMRLKLDAAGAISGMEPADGAQVKERLLSEVQAALASWRFAPARAAGMAVPAELVVPVVCLPLPQANAAKMVPPKPIERAAPEYPIAMRRFGLTGQVAVDFEVNTEGKMVNPVIFESDNPAFDEPALKALLKWKFEPGTRDGKAVNMKLRAPIIFQLSGAVEQKGLVQIERSGDQSKLPPELKYDVPPKFRGVMLPIYPVDAREAGARGKAVVAMLINPQGRVAQVKILSADRPEFGLALVAAAERFRFDPAYKSGKPVPHLLRFEQEFNSSALYDDDSERLLALEKKHPERIMGADKLDAVPAAISRRSPVFPLQVPAGMASGQALIQFLIDTDGHARLPRVISASDPAFGYAGVQAVGTWLFAPPLVARKPVVARVQIPLVFSVKSPPAAGSVSSSTETPETAEGAK